MFLGIPSGWQSATIHHEEWATGNPRLGAQAPQASQVDLVAEVPRKSSRSRDNHVNTGSPLSVSNPRRCKPRAEGNPLARTWTNTIPWHVTIVECSRATVARTRTRSRAWPSDLKAKWKARKGSGADTAVSTAREMRRLNAMQKSGKRHRKYLTRLAYRLRRTCGQRSRPREVYGVTRAWLPRSPVAPQRQTTSEFLGVIWRQQAGHQREDRVTGHQEGSWGLTSPSRRASQNCKFPALKKGKKCLFSPNKVAKDAKRRAG